MLTTITILLPTLQLLLHLYLTCSQINMSLYGASLVSCIWLIAWQVDFGPGSLVTRFHPAICHWSWCICYSNWWGIILRLWGVLKLVAYISKKLQPAKQLSYIGPRVFSYLSSLYALVALYPWIVIYCVHQSWASGISAWLAPPQFSPNSLVRAPLQTAASYSLSDQVNTILLPMHCLIYHTLQGVGDSTSTVPHSL